MRAVQGGLNPFYPLPDTPPQPPHARFKASGARPGNAMMSEFDAAAADIAEKIDSFVASSRKAVGEGRNQAGAVVSGLAVGGVP